MSTIDRLASEAGEAFLNSMPYEIRDEHIRQGVRRIAEERFRINKLLEEVKFEKEVLISLFSPKNTKLAQKLEADPRDCLEEVEGTIKEMNEAIANLDKFKNDIIKNARTLSRYPEMLSNIFNDQMTQTRMRMEKEYDEDAEAYNQFTAQDWTHIKQDLDAKKIAISYDFLNRCQRVAQSIIAA